MLQVILYSVAHTIPNLLSEFVAPTFSGRVGRSSSPTLTFYGGFTCLKRQIVLISPRNVSLGRAVEKDQVLP